MRLYIFARKVAALKKLEKDPSLLSLFDQVVEYKIAGLPQDAKVVSVGISNREIREEFEARGITVSRYLVCQMLSVRGYRKRSLQKNLELAEVEHRDDQFRKIEDIRKECLATHSPIFSIDTKAKELVGQFYRKGALYSRTYRKALDHDFGTFSDGVIIPHGIYDLNMNIGYLTIGTSKDTAEFGVWNTNLLSELQFNRSVAAYK